MSGGSLGPNVNAGQDSVINLSGGTINHGLSTNGRLLVTGTDFRINGTPVGFDYEGQEKQVDVAGVLSGVLADGTPFTLGNGDWIANGSLNLQLAYTPPPTVPAVIQVPVQPAPAGIRGGQSLVLGNGGVIGDGFRAGWGSTLTVTAGTIGDNFDAVGAQVTIAGGSVGRNFDALCGTTVNVRGGAIGYNFIADPGSTVNITGGQLSGITARADSILNVSGGHSPIDNGEPFSIEAAAGSEVHFFGTGFELNGVPIPNLVAGQMTTITDRQVTLSGILADGSSFQYYLMDHDISGYISLNALVTLTVTSVLPGDYNGDGVVDMRDHATIRAGFGTKYSAADYDTWRRHFGDTARSVAGGSANLAVPEPGLLVLLALSGIAFGGRRASRVLPTELCG